MTYNPLPKRSFLEPLEARIAPATFLVTTTADSGAGSLRQAIADSNEHPGADVISFEFGPGLMLFRPTSPLPAITDTLKISGDLNPHYDSVPRFILSGADGGVGNGLSFSGSVADFSRVEGLTISGFQGNGIEISDTRGITIIGCYIGEWSSFAGNAGAGIRITESNDITVGLIGAKSNLTTPGGQTWGASNVVVGNGGAGIQITGGTGHEIYGNLIGLTASGTASANSEGILIQSATVIIGAAGPGDGNVISGNKSRGIYVSTSDGTVIQGNHVGTDIAGTKAVPNGSTGISMIGVCRDTIIGGAQPGEGNLISGNAANGISFLGPNTGVPSDSGETEIQGNRIGTDISGLRPLPNKGNGISVTLRRSILIGGGDLGASNVISGNGGDGIRLLGSEFVTIQQNFIGTNATGIWYCGNKGDGISVFGGREIQIGGASPEQRNIISGNGDYGISLGLRAEADKYGATVESTIQNNYIGTSSNGNFAIGNGKGGIYLGSRSEGNSVDGGNGAWRNVISGNNGPGIVVEGTNNVISGNIIGLNAAGTAILGSGGNGIEFSGTSKGTIVRSNVISGAGVDLKKAGIFVAGENHLIESNRIGYDLTGTIPLGNQYFGITATGKSVISHNQIACAAAHKDAGSRTGISVTGGTHLISDNSIIHSGRGINVTGGSDHKILRNTILDAPMEGIGVQGGGNRATVSNNYIHGLGTYPLGNRGIKYGGSEGVITGNIVEQTYLGIEINGANLLVTDNVVTHSAYQGIYVDSMLGGTIAHNTIAAFGSSGLHIVGASHFWDKRVSNGVIRNNHIHGGNGTGIIVRGGNFELSYNLIYDNAGIAIDLGASGSTPNDPSDADSGANGLQNTITFERTVLGNRHLIIDGSFDGAADRSLRVEYFAILLDETGAEIGAQFLAESVIQTDGTGHANIRESLPPTSRHSRIVATVTDLAEHVTSEAAVTDLVIAPTVIAVGTGAGSKGVAKLVRASALQEVIIEVKPYGERFRSGIRVAHMDVDGDGFEDLITAPDRNGRIVRVFSGFDGTMLTEWKAAPHGYKGGISIAAGDVDGDGTPEIVTALGFGRKSTVTVRDAMTGEVESSFLAFSKNYRSGLNLSMGDLDADGNDDIVASLQSGVALMRAFTGTGESLSPLIRPFEGQASIGAFTAVIPATPESAAQIAVGSGVGARGAVEFFDVSGSRLMQLPAFDGNRFSGLRLASADVDADGIAEIIVARRSGHLARAHVIDAIGSPITSVFEGNLRAGLFLG